MDMTLAAVVVALLALLLGGYAAAGVYRHRQRLERIENAVADLLATVSSRPA